ncbi:hypothetical protein [Chryseobacterium sp. M5A1_1a]
MPSEFVTKLPETVIAEISQPKLKFSSSEALIRFANRVVFEIDPKYSDEDPDNLLSDINLAINKVADFGKRCDLTENEFLIALKMAPMGLLQIDGEKVKFFREINTAQLSQYEQGYVEFKAMDQKHQNGKTEISKLLNPPTPKLTTEEYEAMTMDNIRKDYHRFKADGRVLASPVFYDLIKKNRGDKIKLQFVEDFLKNYVPQTAEGKLTNDSTALPRVIKKDAYVEFQNEMIVNYVMYMKLHETSEELWMQHWKMLYQKSKNNENS